MEPNGEKGQMMGRRDFVKRSLFGVVAVSTHNNPIVRASEELVRRGDENRAKRDGGDSEPHQVEVSGERDATYAQFTETLAELDNASDWSKAVGIFRRAAGNLERTDRLPEGVAGIRSSRQVVTEGGNTETRSFKFTPYGEDRVPVLGSEGDQNLNLEVPGKITSFGVLIESNPLQIELPQVAKGLLVGSDSDGVSATAVYQEGVHLQKEGDSHRLTKSYGYRMSLPGGRVLVLNASESFGADAPDLVESSLNYTLIGSDNNIVMEGSVDGNNAVLDQNDQLISSINEQLHPIIKTVLEE